MTAAAVRVWQTARGPVALDRPRLVGILNLTPDSFYEPSRVGAAGAAVERAAVLLADGADILDLGGESTRPGAEPVLAPEEIRRTAPVIRALVRRWPDLIISVDTTKAEVAAAALDEGAAIVNDVSGLRLDPELAALAASRGAGLILMHSRGTVASMARYELATYGSDPVGEIVEELGAAIARAVAAGVAEEAVVVDPGLGFSKRTEHTLAALAELDRIAALGPPVLVGPSRKRFIGELSGDLPPEERLEGTLAACVAARLRGAHLFRVHDVRAVRRALDVAEAIRRRPA